MSNTLNTKKVAIVGCGFVGSTCAFSLMESKMFSEMVLIDLDTSRAEGEALDISHGIPFYSRMNIYAGTYEDLRDAGIVIVTAGANQKPGETRLDLVQKKCFHIQNHHSHDNEPRVSRHNPCCIQSG